MKLVFIIALLAFLGSSESSYASVLNDSSSIYLTKQQFDNDSGAFFCKCAVQARELFIWSEFGYETDGVVRIKEKKQEARLFKAGSIYGFYSDGIKYMFILSENRYISVLGTELGVTFFVDHIYKTSYVFYLNPQNGKLRDLRKKNLKADFKNDKDLLAKLLILNDKLRDYNGGFTRKNFFKCQKMLAESNL